MEYKVYKHHRQRKVQVYETDSFMAAINYCDNVDLGPLGSENGHAVSIENNQGCIFEVNYYGKIEVNVDDCAASEELKTIEKVVNL